MTRQRGHRLLAGLAVLAQLSLLYYFVVLGLGWGGFWYLANLVQALVILTVAAVLLVRRPLWALPLPVLSLLLMLAFHAVDPSTKTTECSEAELAAVAQLPPPPGTGPLDFESEPANGCIARFHSSLSGEQILDHYRLAADDAGWDVEETGEVVVEPGQSAPESAASNSLYLNNATMTAEVLFERAGDQGPSREQVLVVVSVHRRTR